MTPRLDDPADESIGDLFHQLVDEGGNLIRAEVNLYKQVARHRAEKARSGLIALAIGGILLFDALIVLLVMLAMALSGLVGPVAAGLIVAAAVAVPAIFLVRFGIGKMAALSGDEEEKAALQGLERAA